MSLRLPVAEEMVWAGVTRPRVPLVYLDLNHFIELAKARRADAGLRRDDGGEIKVLPGYSALLEAARRAKIESRAVFPLSSVHFEEVAHRVPSPRQRSDVADVMEELCDLQYLLARTTVVQMEIAAGLDRLYGVEQSYTLVPLIGDSALWAYGRTTAFTIRDADGTDAGSAIREQIGDAAFEQMYEDMNRARERKLLEGPQDSEIPDLLKEGYAPETYMSAMESRLEYERETARILNQNPRLRRGRLRDVVAAREIAHEWMQPLVLHLAQRAEDGLRHDLPSEEEFLDFWAAMPQVQVAISMKTLYHRDPSREWKTNDIADIDALALAYAYCDAVLTDKQARSAIVDSADLRGFGAYLPRTPQEMADWIDALPNLTNPTEEVRHPLVSK